MGQERELQGGRLSMAAISHQQQSQEHTLISCLPAHAISAKLLFCSPDSRLAAPRNCSLLSNSSVSHLYLCLPVGAATPSLPKHPHQQHVNTQSTAPALCLPNQSEAIICPTRTNHKDLSYALGARMVKLYNIFSSARDTEDTSQKACSAGKWTLTQRLKTEQNENP